MPRLSILRCSHARCVLQAEGGHRMVSHHAGGQRGQRGMPGPPGARPMSPPRPARRGNANYTNPYGGPPPQRMYAQHTPYGPQHAYVPPQHAYAAPYQGQMYAAPYMAPQPHYGDPNMYAAQAVQHYSVMAPPMPQHGAAAPQQPYAMPYGMPPQPQQAQQGVTWQVATQPAATAPGVGGQGASFFDAMQPQAAAPQWGQAVDPAQAAQAAAAAQQQQWGMPQQQAPAAGQQGNPYQHLPETWR
jgi:hypothetical protein